MNKILYIDGETGKPTLCNYTLMIYLDKLSRDEKKIAWVMKTTYILAHIHICIYYKKDFPPTPPPQEEIIYTPLTMKGRILRENIR